ncbi:2-amino-4-hydroxy-6-hydroxymethyldihydropteridine diphosphokinase [Bacteroidota bacterium]
MANLYLLTGSNLGDRLSNLIKANEHISMEIGKLICYSNIYETASWGFEHPNKFLNQALFLDTEKTPHEVLEHLKNIEKKMGRQSRANGYEARIIDIDILFYDHLIIKSKELNIPHIHLHKRKFTLIPMVEIAAELIHPVLGKSMLELLENCEDKLEVSKF